MQATRKSGRAVTATARDLLAQARASIVQRDAELLLGEVLGVERTWLLAHPDAEADQNQQTKFASLVERRTAHEPLQYILGRQEFFGLDLLLTPAVLVPRPETELLVEAVLEWAKQQKTQLNIVDVGTGSGAIALALAANLPEANVTALDISDEALALAKENASRLQLEQRVKFVHSDLLQSVEREGGIDVVVSNPPYVPDADAATMQRDVVDYEPHLALFAGEEGLSIYKRLIPQAALVLRQDGLLAMEIGYGQAEALRELLKGWTDVSFLNDYAGMPRIVSAKRP